MPNCQSCSSQTQCTSCYNGFNLEQTNDKSICQNEGNVKNMLGGSLLNCLNNKGEETNCYDSIIEKIEDIYTSKNYVLLI